MNIEEKIVRKKMGRQAVEDSRTTHNSSLVIRLIFLSLTFFLIQDLASGTVQVPPPTSYSKILESDSDEDLLEQGKTKVLKQKVVQKRPSSDGGFQRNLGPSMKINPQNARHPELQIPEDKLVVHGKELHHVQLLPNMFSPIQIPNNPYHGTPYYPYWPYSFQVPVYNTVMPYENIERYPKIPVSTVTNAVLNRGPSYRSGVRGGTGPGQMPGPFPGFRGGRMDSRMGHMYDTFKEGIYGDRLGISHRERKLQDQIDDDEIVPGKFLPCGGECAGEEFLCVGSCICLPIEFRCDGKADCTGSQDELECGETALDADLPCLQMHDDYRCPRSGKCIKKIWLCDGDDDCGDFSDETHCNGKNCTENEFECNNGMCIERPWVCDGDNDCKDNSDEINCTKRVSCTDTEFRCGDGNCISWMWKCDGEADCSDGSDEDIDICPDEPRVCSETEFECTYPRCVRQEFQCDGDDDCGDWSDEDNCPRTDSSCGTHEFSCTSGRCISDRWLCDEELDCEDGEDETNCSEKKSRTCYTDEFTCDNGNCILKSWVCDNIQDCIHGEDEKDCLQRCEESYFDCAAHRINKTVDTAIPHSHPQINCIHIKHVCDGKKDCLHGEDEENCPVNRTCEAGSKCEQDCVTLANKSNACSCRPGFTLAEDGFRCKDVDECMFESEPVCSHLCTNNYGSFGCSCMKGYILRPDARTCKAIGDPPTLLFANRVDIRQLSLNNKKYTAIMKGLENAIALDFHYDQNWIFWSDVSKDIIKRARLNGTEKEVVVKWGLETPGGVAIDWVHNLLFWTDAGTRRVEVSALDGKHRYVVAAHDLDKPRAIAVHPGKGLIFWTDWGPHPKIERADMDGGNRTSIVKESVAWPNGLTIDYPMERIYWADAKHHVIESSMFDGSDRKKVITKGLPHPFAVTLFEDSVFWTDWHTKSIATASKDTGVGYKVLHAGLHFPMDIHSFHSQRQPNYTSHCGAHNGGCSHLCLPTQLSFRCVCPLGLEIQKDKKTCTIPDKMLVFARKKDIRLQQLTSVNDRPLVDMVVPLDGIQSADALAVNPAEQMIYWSDIEGGSISRSRLNGSEQQLLINTNLRTPTGLALDWLGHKLYWADRAARRIEVSNLNGTMRALIVWEGLKAPNDIALNPIAGYIYWTDLEDGKKARIWMAGMDGTYKKKLQIRILETPSGLVVDQESSRLYWTDGGHIMFSNLDGTDHKALKVEGINLVGPHSVAVTGNQVLWTDVDAKAIYSADKMTGKGARTIRSNVSGLTGLAVFDQKTRKIMTPCLDNNGGCSHLCLISPNPAGYSCTCNIGIKLMADGHTCAPGPTNSLIIAHRVDIRQISLDVPYLTDTVLPLPPMKNTVGVDVDMKTGMIYWTDTTEDVIRRSSPDGEIVDNIVVDCLNETGGIAVDSTGRKVYWTDDGRDSLEVAELDGTNRKVLFTTGLDRPRAITLHYHHGLIFWSDWGENARIERSDMDGKNRRIIIGDKLGWPNGLAIDRPSARIFWNDGKTKVIECSNFDGKERRTIITGIAHPYGLVIVGSHVYWTDWSTEGVHRADKQSGADKQMIVANITGPMDIRSVQVENIAENACGTDNGGCSHLCLRNPQGFSCACPSGIVLQPDHKTCGNTPNSYILFTLRRSLARISLDTSDSWDVALPIPGVHMAVAIDFHWAKRRIYYTDVHLHVIRAVNMNNESDTEDVISNNISTADGLAVDWLADNIYWTDTGRKVLEVARLDGSCRKTIISDDLEEPRAITVFPRKGYLFWSDWGVSPKIERSYLDGSSRKLIASSDLGFPNGLTIDYAAKRLYWSDALKDRIETCDLNGRSRVQLIPKATHPFSLTQFGDYIYWTDWYLKSIERADKRTGLEQTSFRSSLDGVMEIQAVSASRQTGSSPCQVNNGGCSHLCFVKEKGYLCDCPDEPDHRPCKKEMKTLGIESVPVNEPEDNIVVEDADTGIKSNLDIIHGYDFDSAMEPEETAPERLMSRSLVVIVSTTVGLVVVIVICVMMVFLVHRRRKEQSNLFYTSGQNVLAFSNPNYTSNVDTVPDKKSFLWKKLKYDRSQERVYGVPEEKPEGIRLMNEKGGSSPPPTPPARFDSINLAIA